MSSPGRELIGLPAAQWVEVHRNRWPSERLSFQEAAGRALAKALDGSALIRCTNVDDRGQLRIALGSMDSVDRAALDLPIPKADDDGNLVRKSIDLQAMLLPVAIKADVTWVMTQTPMNAYVEVSNLDAVVCTLLVSPVMSDLSAIFRLRAGLGPQSTEGRAAKLAQCRQAHDALGLRSDLITPLLDPMLTRQQVVAARQELILSWSEYPDDIGARLMALLCGHLAQAYYAKALKNGTVQEARVINTKTGPLLDATLRNWDGLVDYLGEGLSAADARPIDVPDVVLPPVPPEPIAERIEAIRDWWRLYDARRAAQQPGDPDLRGLVPPRWDYTNPHDSENPQQSDREQYRSSLPVELVERIERLWGLTVLPRVPGTAVTEAHPFIRFGQLLRPAIEVWDDLASTCWSACFAGWAHPLDQMEPRHAQLRRELERLNAPVDVVVYRELCEAGRPHAWLFVNRGMVVSFAISFDDGVPTVSAGDDLPRPAEAAAAFIALRSVVDMHRRAWLDAHLDRLLDAMWRSDLSNAANSYWKRFRGKGSPPTIKQALPDVLDSAARWLNADFGALARITGLAGPITESPTVTGRQLPASLAGVRREVASVLRASVRAGSPEPRETAYRVEALAARVDDVLAYWQAAGAAPPRAAVLGSAYASIVNEAFGCDLEHGYQLLLSATQQTLARSGHPAAADLSPG